MRFKQQTVLISGAASGMGAQQARRFAQEGALVYVADVLPAEGLAVVEHIVAQGGQAKFIELDVTQEAHWQAAMGQLDRLDVLVNNAGISGTDPDVYSTSTWEKLMAIHGKGTFLGIKYAAQTMQQGGAIVNISSIAASIGQHRVNMGYSGSKAAVEGMTRTAAVQLAQQHIRVNAVSPGMMPPMRTTSTAGDASWRQQAVDTAPMQRCGELDEVADAVLFLASSAASFITGTVLAVDGGYLAV